MGLQYLLIGSEAMMDVESVPTLGEYLMQVLLPAVMIIGFWVWKSATPGKMALGMKIVDYRSGEPASIGQLIGRYFAMMLSGIVLAIGYLSVLWDREKRSWHDKLSGTAVVRN